MLVVSILGGPKEKGSSGKLLEVMESQFLLQGWDIERINAGKCRINPCYACEKCYRDGKCVTVDEMDNIFDLLMEADVIISSAPVFFATVPAQFKAIIDRCQVKWAQKYMLNTKRDPRKKRLGYFIATGGAPEHTIPFNCIKEVIDLFYKAIDVKYWGDAFIGNLDKTDIELRQDIIDKIASDAKGLMELFQST